MKKIQFFTLVFYVLFCVLTLSIIGCGGSNLKTPVSDTDSIEKELVDTDDTIVELETTQNLEEVVEVGELDITVTVTKKTVKPGEKVELTASMKGVRGTNIVLNWLNITGFGTLTSNKDNPVTWQSPDTLDEVSTRVEVLQLVVTVISEVVSVEASGIQTETQIFSDTKEILLKVTAN